MAKIIQILKLPNGLLKILVDGIVQASIKNYVTNEKYLQAEVEIHAGVPEEDTEMDAIIRHASTLFSEYVRANRAIPPEVLSAYKISRTDSGGSIILRQISCRVLKSNKRYCASTTPASSSWK